jgi:uncharacterized protein (DUF2252 family)
MNVPIDRAGGAPLFVPPDERRDQGKALRDDVPRQAHGHWKAAKDRRDVVDILEASNRGRMAELVPLRFARMMQSPFTFYRGSAAVMAADLATTPVSGIRVQACGDAHLSNFGGFATPERRLVFDINDFDETLPAPWEWDLKRLVASVVVAGRDIRLSESDANRAARATVRSYRERMADYASMRALAVWYDTIDVDRFLKALESEERRRMVAARIARTEAKNTPEYIFPRMAEHHGTMPRIKDDPPLIFHPTLEQAPGMDSQYGETIKRYRQSLAEPIRVLFDRFHFCDLAFKVVGIGSVGTRCAVALFMAGDDDPLFLQVKEANTSVLEPHAGASKHNNHGERVVIGQRLMQSASDLFLGWADALNGSDVYVRQLRDMKISAVVEGFDAGDLRDYGRVCGWALARAHARSGDAALIAGYMGASETLDDAITDFAVDYADQTHKDHRAFVKAIRQGRIKVAQEG